MLRGLILSLIGGSALWLGGQLYSCTTVEYLSAKIDTIANQFVLRLTFGGFNAIITTHLMLRMTLLLLTCLFH